MLNLETALALLLLSLVVGGGASIPSVAGQNTVSNITANDIIDLVDNNVTESNTENEIPLPLGAIEGLSSIPFVNDADTSYFTAGDRILINDDERTWQRIPDGNNEWQFVESTRGNLNDPDNPTTTTFDSVENTQGSLNNSDTLSRLLDNAYSESNVECVGSAGCVEGVVTRIVDGDTLYVRLNTTIYKVDLALIKAPSRTEEGFMESTAFTRDLCLGSNVLVDPEGMLLTSNSDVLAVVYCSSSNLNSELLDNGYAELEMEQCATSEFANEPWVKDHGC